jgi:O-antigen ligase
MCNVAGFLLAFKPCLTFLLFRSSPHTGVGVTTALTLAWLLLVLGYTVLAPPRYHRARSAVARWIAAYLVLAVVSLGWTTTNSLVVALGYWAGMTADVASIWLLLRYEPLEDNVIRVMRGFIAGAALVAVIVWFAPATADMRLGDEEFLHPNLIGFEFAIATLFAAYLTQLNKAWVWVAGAFFITLIRTLSKGAIVGFFLAGLYYLLRGMKVSHRTRVFIGLAGTVVLLSFWGLLESYLDFYTQSNNLETLTGRTYLWTQALDIASEKPWWGHGFDSFRWVFPPWEDFHPWHAHNELVQQFFAYGIAGILLVVVIYWSFYRQVRCCSDPGLRSLAMAILILVLVRGLVDTDRFDLCFPLWLMTLLSVSLAYSVGPHPPSLS